MAKQRIGEILVKLGYLSPPQLEGALVHQRQWGFGLGRSAVICGFCTEEQVITALSRQLGLPSIDLDQVDLGSSFAPHIPERIAVQHCVVPLRTTGPRSEVLVVAMAPPASLVSQDVVRAIARKARLEVYIASDEAIQRAIARLYRGAPATSRAVVEPQVGALGALGEPPTPPQADLIDQLGLSPRARQAVDAVAGQHSFAGTEVLRRMVERWAANQPIPAPPTDLTNRAS